jgi:hypothetical protein
LAGAHSSAPAHATSATVDWQVPLSGTTAYPRANGSAQYQSQPGQRELQVEVQHVRSLAGRTVVFAAGGRTIGTARVSRAGQADVTRNTERNQSVPSIARGSLVTVRTARGTLIISGRF